MKFGNKKFKIIGVSSLLLAVGLVTTLICNQNNGSSIITKASDEYKSLNLDKTNAYVSGGTNHVTTSTGQYVVEFAYTNASTLANGHVTLSENGTLVNISQLKSVAGVQVNYSGSGTLQAKTAFGGNTYGTYFDIVSGHNYEFSSFPYYISFLASGGAVNIESIHYDFTCVDNAEAEGHKGTGAFDLVKSKSEIKNGDVVYIVGQTSGVSGYTALSTTLANEDRPRYPQGDEVTPSSGSIASGGTEWTVTISGSYYTFTSSNKDLYAYVNGTNYSLNIGTTYTKSGTTTNVVTSYGATNQFTWNIDDSSTGRGYLKGGSVYVVATNNYTPKTWAGKKSSAWSSSTSFPVYLYKKSPSIYWNTPKDAVGFTALDSSKDSYNTKSIYSTDNGLNVVANYSDGTTKILTSSEYTYKVSTDMAGENVIDKTKAFGTAGTYYVTVNYEHCIPSIIQLNVAASISGIEASMTTKTYTTDDTITLSGNLSAKLSYDNGTNRTVSYSEFSAYGISMKLFDPSNNEYSTTSKFLTAGTWKVTCYVDSYSSSVNLTVNEIAVTGITLDKSTATISANGSVQLTATVTPVNATTKTVTWSSNNTSVATVSTTGLVSGVSAGSATITAKTTNNISATCTVTVTAVTNPTLVKSTSSLTVGAKYVIACNTEGVTAGNISSQIMDSVSSTFSTDNSEITTLGSDTVELTLGGTTGAWTFANDDGELLGATAVKKLAWDSGTTTWSISISSEGTATITNKTSSYGSMYYNASSPRFTTYTSAQTAVQLYQTTGAEPIYPTEFSIPTSETVGVGKTVTLTPTFVPSNANQKTVTWSSSNESIATVNNGVVKGVGVGTASITAKCKNADGNDLVSVCTITVTEAAKDKWTILTYICGADLETGSATSSGGYATKDLAEIASVSGQPDDVNIVFECGGAKSWKSTYSSVIDSSKLNRFHLENKLYVKDEQITKANMGLASTLQSFIEWGVTNYPAEKIGLILWNHGGGMRGVCYDENYSDNSLLDNEVVEAVSKAKTNLGISSKFEFIGYDACLMGVQDVAEFNSPYFNYMVAAQESEAGEGWDYDNWLDDLYANKSTTTILKEICDTFIEDNGGVNATGGYYQGLYYPADQTLAYYDLSYMDAYKTAWENMANQLKSKVTTSNKSSFNSIIGATKYFGGSDYDYFCTFDAYHFVTLLESNSTFNPGSTYTSAVKTALNNLVGYNCVQKEAAHDAHGICFYYVAGTGYSQSSYASSTYSNFTNWTYLSKTYGGSITSTYEY